MATTTSENINDAETLPELDVIWKIVSPGELEVWQSSNAFTLESELDKSDGFFHCSNTLRIRKTADLYFKTIYFSTAQGDQLLFNDAVYEGSAGPRGYMDAGDVITWSSDASGTGSFGDGWVHPLSLIHI